MTAKKQREVHIAGGALYCSLWSIDIEKSYGPVVRVTME